jgi:hypothetical protein
MCYIQWTNSGTRGYRNSKNSLAVGNRLQLQKTRNGRLSPASSSCAATTFYNRHCPAAWLRAEKRKKLLWRALVDALMCAHVGVPGKCKFGCFCCSKCEATIEVSERDIIECVCVCVEVHMCTSARVFCWRRWLRIELLELV